MTIIELRDMLDDLIKNGKGDCNVLAWQAQWYEGDQGYEPANAEFDGEDLVINAF